jgi:hypothetical protein
MFRAASAGPAKAVTANRLDDGLVVFLGAEGAWVKDFAAAELFQDGPELEAALAYGKAQHDARVVVEPYAIDVDDASGRYLPTRIRERIRALGPTVDYGAAENERLRGPLPQAAE